MELSEPEAPQLSAQYSVGLPSVAYILYRSVLFWDSIDGEANEIHSMGR